MKERRGSQLWRKARLTAVTLVAIAATGPACLSRPLEPVEPRTTSTIVEKLTQSSVDKIDLLLAIDNSASMADKQQILNAAVPDLVSRLVNPICINPDTKQPLPADQQPASPTDKCPGTAQREFAPVLDIHIGIVSSSLGNHTGDQNSPICPDAVPNSSDCNGKTNYTNNDHGHLITRTDPCSGAVANTYQNLGFLAWDPKQKDEYPPGTKAPGESDLGNLTKTITDLVNGTGQIGCGFEAQNEAWLRFLIDPNPYKSLTVENGKTVQHDRDDELLKERQDFLRPDSLLAIIMLTDENDCSIQDRGIGWAAVSSGQLPRARAVCATNPNDKCCVSCGQKADPSCGDDPTCSMNGGKLTSDEDTIYLRCFNEKQRFGIDFLYPTQRYVNALTLPALNPNRADFADDGKGTTTPNPIYSDLNANDNDSTIRDPGLVFLAGIVGVPWQDIARDPNDLGKGFKTVSELEAKDANGVSGWDQILGDPTGGGDGKAPIPPADPHMIEAVGARNGLPPPGSPNGTDPINGHEWTPTGNTDLQYACIFELPTERDCSDPANSGACDCSDPTNDNPLCEPNPNDPMGGRTIQKRAKAYPGLRHLEILKGLGDQGIVASVCPKQVGDKTQPDYGYRPAIGAIIDRLKTKLGGQCLPRTLTVVGGQVPCVIIEATKADDANACNKCDSPDGRQPVDPLHKQAVAAAKADELNKTNNWNCFCELTQLTTKAEQTACETDTSDDKAVSVNGQPVNGWCYIDPAEGVGSEKLVETCDSAEKRKIRFVGSGAGKPGSTLFITCSGDSAE